jgi:GNAT superfamily N-acetyltransferase
MKNKEITIKKVETRKDLLDFIKLPWKIYKDYKYWVPPLISEKKAFFNPQVNPFYRHAEVVLFLAEKNGEIAGRIAGIVNHKHIETHQEKAGFFGFFEVIEDFEVAKRLLDKVKDWLKSRGMEIMRGPMNFSVNDEIGFLLEGFDSPPVFMMSYNPKYYLEFMERYGMVKAKDLYAFYMDKNNRPPERFIRIAEKIRQRENIVVRKLNLKDFDTEIEKIKKIYNLAWSKNWGAVPMTDEEFEHLARDFKKIVDPDLVFIAEVDGEPAGFSMALPNINQLLIKLNGRLFPFGIFKLLWYTRIHKVIDGIRILTMGVIHKYQKRGIDTTFYIGTYLNAEGKGYRWAEMSWNLEDNFLINHALETFGAKLYKKYRIYEVKI